VADIANLWAFIKECCAEEYLLSYFRMLLFYLIAASRLATGN
jgi:hypothetical protein